LARPRRVKPDEQLTLVEHLDELRSRILVVLVVFTIAIGVCFYEADRILQFLATPLPLKPGEHTYKFLALSPLDGILTSISIAFYSALLLTMPIATYQLYAFVIPAFAEGYHKHIKPLVIMIPILFIFGVVFGWYLVVPPAIGFVVGYNSSSFDYSSLRAGDYVQFVLLTLLAMGIVFEMPAVMLVLARLRIMSSALMRRYWRISIVILAVIAMLLPGVDPISFIVEFIPLLALYGFSYFIVLAVERTQSSDEPDPEPLT
jgi:sec-independent protein translocase protein TatC